MSNDDSAPPPTNPHVASTPSAEPTQTIDSPPTSSSPSTTRGIGSNAAETDSAPPPSQPTSSYPPTRPRDYSSEAGYNSNNKSISTVQSLPPAYAPNSTVPNFIRTLALVVFVIGGTTAAGVAWVYKNIIYPRLVLALKARTKLHQAHLVKYTSFVDQIKSFGRTGSRQLIGGLHESETIASGETEKDLITEGVQTEEKAELKPNKGSEKGTKEEKEPLLSSEDASSTDAALIEEDPIKSPPAPQILSDLTASLSGLSSALRSPIASSSTSASTHPPRSAASAQAFAAAQSRQSPDHTLISSLETLNSFVENELYQVVSQGYRTYGSVSGTSGASSTTTSGSGKERRAMHEAQAGFKSEIRAVKGLLLNRRNFAVTGPGTSRVGA